MSSRTRAPGSARARRARVLGAILVLACAAGPASSSPLLSSALALGLHVHDHAHAVSVLFDDGHADLVLSHPHAHPAPDHSEGLGLVVSAAEHHDHVVHVAVGDSAHPRRAAPIHVTLVGFSYAPRVLPPPPFRRESSAPRAPIAAVSSPVVLRL